MPRSPGVLQCQHGQTCFGARAVYFKCPHRQQAADATASFVAEWSKNDRMTASVDELQGKLHEALNFDQKKAQVNDAKLRAVHQKAEYEEFEKMVAGAHLKPVKPRSQESAAISKQFSGYVMPTYAPQAAAPTPAPPAASLSAEQQFAPPTTSNDFLRTWRRQCKTPEAKFRYLHTFDPDALPLLFRSEMEPAVLDGIAQALQVCALPPADAAAEAELQEAPWVELLLRYLCRVNRFGLTLDLADKGAPSPPRRPDGACGLPTHVGPTHCAGTKQTLAACFDALQRNTPAEAGSSEGRLDGPALVTLREAYKL